MLCACWISPKDSKPCSSK